MPGISRQRYCPPGLFRGHGQRLPHVSGGFVHERSGGGRMPGNHSRGKECHRRIYQRREPFLRIAGYGSFWQRAGRQYHGIRGGRILFEQDSHVFYQKPDCGKYFAEKQPAVWKNQRGALSGNRRTLHSRRGKRGFCGKRGRQIPRESSCGSLGTYVLFF